MNLAPLSRKDSTSGKCQSTVQSEDPLRNVET